MRIITFNANGIRSAADKGFFRWLSAQDADVVCVQETRARIDQLSDGHFRPEGYHCFYYDAERPGYAGTALYSRRKPDAVTQGLGWEPVDSEARWLQADFPGLSVVSLYMPSGSSGREWPGVGHLRGLEHLPQGDRSQELAGKPEELGLSARGAGMAGRTFRSRRLRGCVPYREPASRSVHLVVQPRACP
jgi:hypothetical protein